MNARSIALLAAVVAAVTASSGSRGLYAAGAAARAAANADYEPPGAADGPYAKAPALGIRIGALRPGRYDAITDVAGVRVGHITHVAGAGPLVPGHGPVRTGVTAIVPRDDVWHRKVFAAAWPLNGNGEMTGATWINEAGWLEVPILLTDTLSVGRVDDGVVSWMIKRYSGIGRGDDVPLPVVAECDDEYLNDQQGRHNTAADAEAALNAAGGGPVAQGSVGAGTGMMSFRYKGGIGSASRVLQPADGAYTVGVLLNANNGGEPREHLTIQGVPVGAHMQQATRPAPRPAEGSIVVVIATDAPLLADQLLRLCKRAALGLARTGASSRTGSGDLIIAFSTANSIAHYPHARTFKVVALDQYHIDPLFQATEDATEEALVNALLAAQTVVGRDGHVGRAIPHAQLLDILRRYGR
jgi:D-aminopeptidase